MPGNEPGQRARPESRARGLRGAGLRTLRTAEPEAWGLAGAWKERPGKSGLERAAQGCGPQDSAGAFVPTSQRCGGHKTGREGHTRALAETPWLLKCWIATEGFTCDPRQQRP